MGRQVNSASTSETQHCHAHEQKGGCNNGRKIGGAQPMPVAPIYHDGEENRGDQGNWGADHVADEKNWADEPNVEDQSKRMADMRTEHF